MLKAKKFDWNDSNLALFGSDTEKNVKKESAETEKAWKGSGQKAGLEIWKIEKFKVVNLEKEDYGKFFDGDSYIVLNTYKNPESDELLYDVHFWIGKHSTQDEYGTAAYKTVELDTFHNDKPVQHREVQGHESSLFKSYFPTMTIMKGGSDSGFRKVQPTEYKTRLFHVTGTRSKINVIEVGPRAANLTDDDVFILDRGLEIYQWNGPNCNKDEKFKATTYLQGIKSERGGKAKVTVLEGDGRDELEKHLNNKPKNMKKDTVEASGHKVLFRLSDEEGKMQFSEVKTGHVTKDDFDSNDVFIFDTSKEVFVWIGSGASRDEKKHGMEHAHNYLTKTDHPFLPISVIQEGQRSMEFQAAIAA